MPLVCATEPDNSDPRSESGPKRTEARLPVPGSASRVLLFGGTFDPPHTAHLDLALLARDRVLGPDAWLVLVPAARSPHKDSGPIASDEDRVAMLEMATCDAPNVGVWTYEIDRGRSGSEPSFWVRTVEYARACLTDDASLRFLIGADQAVSFHRWRSFREILSLARPVVMLRRPIDTLDSLDSALASSGAWTADERAFWRDHVADLPVVDVSATSVRAALAAGHKVGAAKLHPEVEQYIRSHGLYGAGRGGSAG